MMDSGYRPEESAQAAASSIQSQYIGHPASDMVRRYGVPESQMSSGAGQLYQWSISDQIRYNTQSPLNVTCRMQATVDSTGMVRGIDFSGQAGGCALWRP